MLNFFGSPPLRPSSAVICSSTRSHNCTAEPITSCAASGGAQSTLSKTAKEGRIREFVEITGASSVSSSPFPSFPLLAANDCRSRRMTGLDQGHRRTTTTESDELESQRRAGCLLQ